MHRRTQHRPGARGGFTLIEILVVIAIIAIIMGLVTAAVFKGIVWIEGRNTERTIQKLTEKMTKQQQDIIAIMRQPDALVTDPTALSYYPWAAPTGGASGVRIGQVIYAKFLTKVMFPMNYAEIKQNITVFGNDPGHLGKYARYYYTELRKLNTHPNNFLNPPNPTSYNPATESGACLAMIYGRFAAPDDSLTPAELKDTDGDGVKEMCDAWDTPLVFFRWPTYDRLVENAFPPDRRLKDDQDPEGLIDRRNTRGQSWYQYQQQFPNAQFPNSVSFENALHLIGNPADGNGQPSPIYAPIVIVSAGIDQKFGIPVPTTTAPAPMQIVNVTDAADNLYSYQIRLALEGR